MKYKLNIGQLPCLLILAIFIVFVSYQGFIRIAPKLFPKKENLHVQEWTNYQNKKTAIAFTIKYPTGWKVTPKYPYPCNEASNCIFVHSPWNNLYSPWNIPEHDLNKSYVQINIGWESPETWSNGIDELLGSAGDITNKIENTPENFDQETVNGYKALFAKEDKTKNNSVYIFTDKEIFKFTLDFKTQDNPQKVKDTYYHIINSFQLIE